MSNREIAETFANCFDPPLNVVKTEKINGAPMRDAWMVATFDSQTGWGITAHAYAGQLHAFVETLSREPEAVGNLMAQWLKEASNNLK